MKIELLAYDQNVNAFVPTNDSMKMRSNPISLSSMFESYLGYFLTIDDDTIVFAMDITSDGALFHQYARTGKLVRGYFPGHKVRSGEYAYDGQTLVLSGYGPTFDRFDPTLIASVTDQLKSVFGVSDVVIR